MFTSFSFFFYVAFSALVSVTSLSAFVARQGGPNSSLVASLLLLFGWVGIVSATCGSALASAQHSKRRRLVELRASGLDAAIATLEKVLQNAPLFALFRLSRFTMIAL